MHDVFRTLKMEARLALDIYVDIQSMFWNHSFQSYQLRSSSKESGDRNRALKNTYLSKSRRKLASVSAREVK